MAVKQVKIGIVGDIIAADSPLMAGRGVYSSCKGNFGPLFAALAEYSRQSDFLIGNFEGVLVEKITGRSPATMSMKTPATILPVFRQCKFKFFSIANNHSMESGPIAFRWMCDQFEQAGMITFGHKNNPFVVFHDPDSKIKIGLLAFSTVPAGHGFHPEYYLLNPYEPTEVNRCLDMVRQTKLGCDHLFVFPHWGSEFMPQPAAWQKDLAQKLIGYGADAIFGAHPHIIQTACLLDGKPVCFSLGNLLSDYFQDRLRRNLVVTAILNKTEMAISGHIFSYDDHYTLFAADDKIIPFSGRLETDSERNYLKLALDARRTVRREMIHHLLQDPLQWIFNTGMWRWLIGRLFFIARNNRKIKTNPDFIYS